MIKLLGSLLASVELKAKEKGITINVNAPRSLPLVQGDYDQLTQAFHNLFDNAMKYGRENGTITLTAEVYQEGFAREGEKSAEVVAVSITDDGPGIPPQHLHRLTERFYRVNAPREKNIVGTGLGLAIVKHIINRHRGRLQIASDLGKGTTFTILLPVAAAEEEDFEELIQ
jgi:two-component system phosphate regulon sensor histidine kinase PhoR